MPETPASHPRWRCQHGQVIQESWKQFDRSNVTAQRLQIYLAIYRYLDIYLSIHLSVDLFIYTTKSCHKPAITAGSIHFLQLTIRTAAEHTHPNFPNIDTMILLDPGKQMDTKTWEHKAGGWGAWTFKWVDFPLSAKMCIAFTVFSFPLCTSNVLRFLMISTLAFFVQYVGLTYLPVRPFQHSSKNG